MHNFWDHQLMVERAKDGRPVLLTDLQDRPALAAIRCLHTAGYRVDATATSRLAAGLWSRRCASRRVLTDPHVSVDRYTSELEQLVRQKAYALLLPGTDETLYAVSSRRQQLTPHVEMGLPEREAVERALDKVCLATEAAEAGIPTPEGHVCADFGEALDAAREFGFPTLVKATRAVVEIDGRLVRYPTKLVSDEPELRKAQQHIGRCIVQRRCEGNVMSVVGVATTRGLLGTAVARYRRTWPPAAGMASFAETITPPGSLTEQVHALVEGIGWRGVFQLQMIEDRDGRHRAIDFNPRLFGSMRLASAAGVPLAALWCRWLLGEDPSPVNARPGAAYRWEDGDLRHIIWRLRGGEVRAAISAAKPRRGTIHPYFDARDPVPFLVNWVHLGQARLTRRRRLRDA